MTDTQIPAPVVPTPMAPAASVPGQVLGIIGLIAACLIPVTLVGLILSIVARSQSKKAGVSNTPAKVGMIIGIILTTIVVLYWISVIVLAIVGARSN